MSDQTETMQRAPQGVKLEGIYGPGNLRPGVGKLVQRSGEPTYCGAMLGRAFGYTVHPNKKDPTKESVRFVGQFINIDYIGKTHNVNEEYLPSVIGRTIQAALDLQQGTQIKDAIQFAVEVWCEPDEEGKPTPLGYRYSVYDRVQKKDNDPLLALAYETGLLARPALPAPDASSTGDEEVNPETGEITKRGIDYSKLDPAKVGKINKRAA